MASVSEIETKVKKAMKFIGENTHYTSLCGHRYDFGTMKRTYNQIEYDSRSGKIRLRGHNGFRPRRTLNRVLGPKSKCRSEALRAIFNSLLPEVHRVGRKKMEREKLNSYLKSKNVPLSI